MSISITNKELAVWRMIDWTTLIPGVIWKGFALSTMWKWFVVPLGAPPIGIANVIGILVLGRFAFGDFSSREKTDEEKIKAIKDSIGTSVFVPAIALAVGWTIKIFV